MCWHHGVCPRAACGLRDDNRRILTNPEHGCWHMITPDPSLPPKRAAWLRVSLAALCLVGVIGGALWWFGRVDASTGATLTPGARDAGANADVSPQEWVALKEAVSKTSHPDAELQRAVAYLRFQKALGQWQGLQQMPATAQRHRLAATLLAQLPDRWQQGELTKGEALSLASALWADLEPDEHRRQIRITEFQSALAEAARPTAPAPKAHEDAQQAEYQRREATIVLEYRSLPEAQRDQVWLEDRLGEARRAVYGAN